MAKNKVRKFDGKPLRDATSPMLLPILDMDRAAAEAVKSEHVDDANRFKECVLAQGCIRTFGPDSKVRIMRRRAYISMPNSPEALRFSLSEEAYRAVEAFDKDEPIETGLFLQLDPPPFSHQLKVMRKYARDFRRKHPDYKKGARITKRKQRPQDPKSGVVRNGTYVKL